MTFEQLQQKKLEIGARLKNFQRQKRAKMCLPAHPSDPQNHKIFIFWETRRIFHKSFFQRNAKAKSQTRRNHGRNQPPPAQRDHPKAEPTELETAEELQHGGAAGNDGGGWIDQENSRGGRFGALSSDRARSGPPEVVRRR